MKKFEYTISSHTIWTSFDYGTVEAENIEQAREKALAELKNDFTKANDALAHCDITQGFKLDFDEKSVEVKEILD
jgi:hypothetical protein